MNHAQRRLCLLLAAGAPLLGCTGDDVPAEDRALASEIAQAIIAACPPAPPDDETARAACASNLTGLAILRDSMAEPFLWGAQKPGASYRLTESDTTRFNPFVWRRMYLSLFTFTGTYSIEQEGDLTVIHLPYQFRNKMDIGAYPYPFWHANGKWESWQYSPELLLVIDKHKLAGALRSAERDRTRPFINHNWSGQWRWQEGGQEMPYASLYKFLFSSDNPHVARLDAAFRALESGLRENACFVCHSPDNLDKMPQLELFNYPNQALHSRRKLAVELARNSMPPKNEMGFPVGIADAETRQELLNQAIEFERAGDAALAWENQ